MFSIQHFIWLFITFSLVTLFLIYCLKKRPDFNKFLNVCCIICLLSELIKIFSSIELIPSSDGSTFFPYIQTQHLPFHLCSIQIIFIFIIRFSKESKLKDRIYAFLYPTTIIGALFALFLPSIFSTSISIQEAFTHPLAYQFFIYHGMLIVLGVYIYIEKKNTFTISYYFSTEAILFLISVISIYLNSIFASPVYKNGKLESVEYVTNFFFTYRTPIGIALTEKWQWFLYLGILILLCWITIGIAYIPVFIKCRHNKTKKETAV